MRSFPTPPYCTPNGKFTLFPTFDTPPLSFQKKVVTPEKYKSEKVCMILQFGFFLYWVWDR